MINSDLKKVSRKSEGVLVFPCSHTYVKKQRMADYFRRSQPLATRPILFPYFSGVI